MGCEQCVAVWNCLLCRQTCGALGPVYKWPTGYSISIIETNLSIPTSVQIPPESGVPWLRSTELVEQKERHANKQGQKERDEPDEAWMGTRGPACGQSLGRLILEWSHSYTSPPVRTLWRQGSEHALWGSLCLMNWLTRKTTVWLSHKMLGVMAQQIVGRGT